ncbi:MAG: hypothetical protein U0R19_21700 [Bryobacteraceae bacterium]
MIRILSALLLASITAYAQQQQPIKPTLRDTIKGSGYADNWFALYINGKLTTVDPIDFLPHNQVNIDILPEYPMTIAVIAKDNADPATGLEYGDQIGDAGFILRFADGTVTSARWKAKVIFRGPTNRSVTSPEVSYDPVPPNWFEPDFDDSDWPFATEYTEEQIRPSEAYIRADFQGARFIWSKDLELDNTVLFRYKVEKPGWQPRWTTKPELDNTCVFAYIPLACQPAASAQPAAARKEKK